MVANTNTNYRDQHSAPKMDEMKENHPYSFTVNPPDDKKTIDKMDFESSLSAPDPVVSLIKEIREYHSLLKNLRYCEFVLYPELSPKGRLHFHGIIKIKDIIRFYWHDINRLKNMFHYEIDSIEDFEIWDKYCKKQLHLFEPIYYKNVNKLPITS